MEKSKISTVIILVISFTTRYSAGFEACNAIYLNGDEKETPGRCVTFPECPTLFDILKSPYKTSQEIKILQRLTCRPDNDNPTICCALEDISGDISNSADYSIRNSNKSQNQHGSDNSDGIVFEFEAKKPTTKQTTHPNFHLLPSLMECSIRASSTDRINGGKEVSLSLYPWLARLGYYSQVEDTVKYLCAGTIINKRYILTAAHCTQEINTDEYTPIEIRVAEKDKTCSEVYGCSTPIDLKIEEIIPHPNYSKKDKSNDIGLIRVAQDIPYGNGNLFVSPVCLPFAEDYGQSKESVDPGLTTYADSGKAVAEVSGWGKTYWTHSEGSDSLQYVLLPVISQDQCQRSYKNLTRLSISNKQLCAGGERGKDSCSGDSGGGLFLERRVLVSPKLPVKKFFQYGVVSFGPTHCGIGGLPGVYSKIYEYRDWILDQLKP